MSVDQVGALTTRADVGRVIRETEDRVLALRFGRATDAVCMELDHILEKTALAVRKFAAVYTVDVDSAPDYVRYFDISLIPATVFFFNAKHIKVDYGQAALSTQDNTKFIGTFAHKQDLIDLLEVIYRGAMRGKLIVTSPIDKERIQQYQLQYLGY
ncbi:Thioredoxin-like protein 4B [Sorochytrium milnesiophthora]